MKDLEIRKIRPLEYDDAMIVNSIRNQSCEYLHDDRTFTLEQTIVWLRDNKPDWYIIELGGRVVGYFRISNYSESNRNLYIGADIDESMRGMGIGYESYLMMMEILFRERKLNKITLEVLDRNIRAHALYVKLGFVEEGRKRQEVYRKGTWLDSIVMSMTRLEFISRHGRITSPCIGICQREDGKCNACGRSMEQVSKWKDYSNEERIDAVKEIAMIRKHPSSTGV